MASNADFVQYMADPSGGPSPFVLWVRDVLNLY